jgi:hypothetical protein
MAAVVRCSPACARRPAPARQRPRPPRTSRRRRLAGSGHRPISVRRGDSTISTPTMPGQHSADAKGAHLLAQKHRGEDHGQQRRGIADGGHLGQRQDSPGRQSPGPSPSCPSAAPDMAERVCRRNPVRQFAPPGQPANDHRNGKEGPEEHRLARRHMRAVALIIADMTMNTRTEPSFIAMPRRGRMGHLLMLFGARKPCPDGGASLWTGLSGSLMERRMPCRKHRLPTESIRAGAPCPPTLC